MNYPNLFDENESAKMIARVQCLTPNTQAKWGTMDVAQMLAHCVVPYAYEFESEKYGPPSTGLKQVMMRLFLKGTIAGPKPYKKNSPTAPDFKIADARDFEIEKIKLVDYIARLQKLGAEHFEQKMTQSIGKLSADEWNTMFYKHLDHHLQQFGV